MEKSLTKLLIITFSALIFLPCFSATPVPSNPYFTWRTQNEAEQAFAISNSVITADSCIFSNCNRTVVFYNGSRRAEIDDVTVWLNVATELTPSSKQWHISAIDMDMISLALLSQTDNKPAPLKIVIDPGHGGDDSGAMTPAKDFYEKDINLELAKRVGKILSRTGLKVYYTRERDKTLSLGERSAVARRKKADLFVSIHANKAANTNACGVETFVLTPSGYHGTAQGSPPRGWQIGNKNDYNNNLLGYSIQKELIKLEQAFDRGLKRQSFFVLRETHCPAALIEAGFLSNRGEAQRMKSGKWQAGCAEKIANGILDYCLKVNSLNKAVATKRKLEAEANERWQDYLAKKKEERLTEERLEPTAKTEPILLAATSQNIIQPKALAAPMQNAEPIKVDVIEDKKADAGESMVIDLQGISRSSVQSIATNIYLKSPENEPQDETSTTSLKTLTEFYETGKVK